MAPPNAVRDVIDVQEGDRNRAKGNVNDALNDLPPGLIRLALAVPPEALQETGEGIEGFLGQQDLFGGLPISLESFDKLEIFGFALGQDGETLKVQVRLDFADQESASTIGDLLVLQRQFREGCGVMPAWRRGAWHGSVWPVRYCPAYPQATAATWLARTVPGAAFPAPPGRPAAS